MSDVNDIKTKKFDIPFLYFLTWTPIHSGDWSN